MCPAGAASGVIYYPRGDGRRHETEVKAGCDIGCTDLTEAKYEHAKRGGNAVIDVITNTDWTIAWTSYMIRMAYEQPEHGVHYRASRHGGWQSSVSASSVRSSDAVSSVLARERARTKRELWDGYVRSRKS